jgi:hypothetical protein
MTTNLFPNPRRRGTPPRPDPLSPALRFTPSAWLKWQFLCHAGPTEAAGFGRSADGDPLLVEDVLVVRQRATPAAVALDDAAVADLFDEMVDTGVSPDRFARVWLHTHPGASAEPSGTDEATFERAFGRCDWAVMAILGRTGRTSARLRFAAGPGGDLDLPVAVDWAAWPAEAECLAARLAEWRREYATRIEPAPLLPADAAVFDDPFAEDPARLYDLLGRPNPLLSGEPHERG